MTALHHPPRVVLSAVNNSVAKAKAIATDWVAAPSIRERADAVRYEDSLADFIAASWRFVEPMEFKGNWHIDAICEHLEAVADWQVNRLLINMPPRHMKSLGANVFFPAWVWAQEPNPDNDPGYPFAIRRNSWRGPGVKFMTPAPTENTLATRLRADGFEQDFLFRGNRDLTDREA